MILQKKLHNSENVNKQIVSIEHYNEASHEDQHL